MTAVRKAMDSWMAWYRQAHPDCEVSYRPLVSHREKLVAHADVVVQGGHFPVIVKIAPLPLLEVESGNHQSIEPAGVANLISGTLYKPSDVDGMGVLHYPHVRTVFPLSKSQSARPLTDLFREAIQDGDDAFDAANDAIGKLFAALGSVRFHRAASDVRSAFDFYRRKLWVDAEADDLRSEPLSETERDSPDPDAAWNDSIVDLWNLRPTDATADSQLNGHFAYQQAPGLGNERVYLVPCRLPPNDDLASQGNSTFHDFEKTDHYVRVSRQPVDGAEPRPPWTRLFGRISSTAADRLRSMIEAVRPDLPQSLTEGEFQHLFEGWVDNFGTHLLEAASEHSYGRIHGDLHSGNILLGDGDFAATSEFGIIDWEYAFPWPQPIVFDPVALEMSLRFRVLWGIDPDRPDAADSQPVFTEFRDIEPVERFLFGTSVRLKPEQNRACHLVRRIRECFHANTGHENSVLTPEFVNRQYLAAMMVYGLLPLRWFHDDIERPPQRADQVVARRMAAWGVWFSFEAWRRLDSAAENPLGFRIRQRAPADAPPSGETNSEQLVQAALHLELLASPDSLKRIFRSLLHLSEEDVKSLEVKELDSGDSA